jgi:DNA polymerase-4
LDDLGIETVRKLREQELDFLVAEFGNCGGHKLYDMCRGIDDSSVVAERYAPEARSVSRAYTMSEDTFDKKKIKQLLLTLAEKCGRALREKHLAGRTIEIFFRFEDFTHAGCRVTVKDAINDGLRIYNFGERILQKYRLPKAVRLVGVRISNLLPASGQTSLWLTERKRALLLPYLDKINDQYGESTIKSGLIADAQPLRRKVGGFKSKDI